MDNTKQTTVMAAELCISQGHGSYAQVVLSLPAWLLTLFSASTPTKTYYYLFSTLMTTQPLTASVVLCTGAL